MIPRVRPSYTRAELRAILLPSRQSRQQLERELARKFGMREAILFPYGRSAIYGVLRACDLRGEIVQPAYNCVVVAHATVKADSTPVFVDCSQDDPNQDMGAMIDAVNPKTVAVIPTSIFGQPFDAPLLVEQIRRKNKGAFVLLDCAQAFTARWKDELLAAQGDAAILAFGIGKAMTTLFGGAVLTDRADVAHKIRTWQKANFSPPTYVDALKRLIYFFASWAGTTEFGTLFADRIESSPVMSGATVKRLRSREAIRLPKSNRTFLAAGEASIGLAQLPRLDLFIERRRAISRIYEGELSQAKGIQLFPWCDGATHTIYSIRLEVPKDRPVLLQAMRKQGVQGGTVLDYVVPGLDCYRELGFQDAFPNARAFSENILNLPNHPSLSDAQVIHCARRFRAALAMTCNSMRSGPLHVGESLS